MDTLTINQTKIPLVFPCTCSGCERRLTCLVSIYDVGQLFKATCDQGHYFSPNTMKFFHSRLAYLYYSPACDTLTVITSNAGDMDNTYRVWKIVKVCKYGVVWGDVMDNYSGLKQAKKYLLKEPSCECECHGCQIDRHNA